MQDSINCTLYHSSEHRRRMSIMARVCDWEGKVALIQCAQVVLDYVYPK
jgi:hypothetical protein